MLGMGILAGCRPTPPAGGPGGEAPADRLQSLRFVDAVEPQAANGPVRLRSARNETIDLPVQINDGRGSRRGLALRLTPLTHTDGSVLAPGLTGAWRMAAVPVATNHAAFVRYAGATPATHMIPRALVPLALEQGRVDLSGVRLDGAPLRLWLDIHVPPLATPGTYTARCELLESGSVTATLDVQLTVDEFILPVERHVALVGHITWESLIRHWPAEFATLAPRLLSRRNEAQQRAVAVLDQMSALAHAHRADIAVPRLQPTVKWLGGQPIFDWSDFDSVVGPWLRGEAFADTVPAVFWPLPAMDRLADYPAAQQAAYWAEVAAHFDQLDWLGRSAALVPPGGGPVDMTESFRLSDAAAALLEAHGRLRATVPLTLEQLRPAGPGEPGRLRPEDAGRLLVAADPLVGLPSLERPGVAPSRWLAADAPGLVPTVAAGLDERQTRLLAWLAYLREAQLVQWNSILPASRNPGEPAAADEVVWFYPGEWFGLAGPVPSVQLKWLRRAEQDYEYLWLARQRGQGDRARQLASLLVRPVVLLPGQLPDPVLGLLSTSARAEVWESGLELLARTIQLAQPGQEIDTNAERQLGLDVAAWITAQSRPLLLPRTARWVAAPAGMTRQVGLQLSVDVYNPGVPNPLADEIGWQSVPEAWAAIPAPRSVPRSAMFGVRRAELEAAVDLDSLPAARAEPARLSFTEGYSRQKYEMPVVLPVAFSEERRGAAPVLDGSLGDWSADDALFQGRMVQLLSRPALQDQRLNYASTESALYSTWTARDFYLGFRVQGADQPPTTAERSFVERQLGRAWGEDVAEVLLQPVYTDGEGPLFLISLKPRGQLQVRRRLDPRQAVNPWQAYGSSDILYAANVTQGLWRGEVRIPWDALLPPGRESGRPVLLRMNFLQHRGRTGESASWAGPVDQILDEGLMGLVQIRTGRVGGFAPRGGG
jgi:hypothetical protein